MKGSKSTSALESAGASAAPGRPNAITAYYQKLDGRFNAFHTQIRLREIFTGPLSVRMIELGRRLDQHKSIIDDFGRSVERLKPAAAGLVWESAMAEAARIEWEMEVASPVGTSLAGARSSNWDVMALAAIENLERRFDCLVAVRLAALRSMLGIPMATLPQPTVASASARRSLPFAKVMVMGALYYELAQELQTNTSYRVWRMNNIRTITMETIVRQSPHGIHEAFADIFVFTDFTEYRAPHGEQKAARDLSALLAAIRRTYGSGPRLTLCRWPANAGGGMLKTAEKVCSGLGVATLQVYPDCREGIVGGSLTCFIVAKIAGAHSDHMQARLSE